MSDIAILKQIIYDQLTESSEVKINARNLNIDSIAEAATILINALKNKKKILIIGNGGSAADAQHIAAEFVGRFSINRKPLPAIALTTDSSIMSAIANDFGYEEVFKRQIEAIGEEGDVLIAISTSGKSANIIAAIKAAKIKNIKIIGLTGNKAHSIEGDSDLIIKIPSDNTPRVQEAHITIAHVLCSIIEMEFFHE